MLCEAKTFILKGGESNLAITKQQKEQLVAQYSEWLNRSHAMFLVEYKGLTMKQIDELRAKFREIGGEFHIVKNTLSKVAFRTVGLTLPEKFLDGSTAIAFAFQDVPGMAKTVLEFSRNTDFFKIKGGYLDKSPISAEGVKSLAELPPLPVMRAQLLGVMTAPASNLVRILAEPARQLAYVLKAYAEKSSTPAMA
jgi:large subunit ribosomal protein L10